MRLRLIIAAQAGLLLGLAVLSTVLARRLNEAHRALAAVGQVVPALPAATEQRPLRLRLQAIPPVPVRTELVPLDWSSLESEDYATYVANLRRIRCPEETIRDIIVADVNQLYAARRRALPPLPSRRNYWRHPDEESQHPADAEAARDRQAALLALDRERRQLLRGLLGDTATQAQLAEYRAEIVHDPALEFLDDSKRQTLAQAMADWRLALEEADALPDDEERASAERAASRALEEALAQNLTPEEREQYDLRISPLADELRQRLRGFQASKEEFDQLFRLEKSAEEERDRLAAAGATGQDPQWEQRLEANAIEQEQAIRQLLGPERYAEYRRSQDPDYQTLYSLALDHDVPTDVASQVWSMRREVERQTAGIRANPLLSADQKERALEAIRFETQASIVDVLGEPLVRDYEREGGAWLSELTAPLPRSEPVPDPEPTPPPTPQAPSPQQALALPAP